MKSKRQNNLSAAEWKVMRVVWDLKKAMAREVYTVAGEEHGWTPATVKTLLKRLVDKGYLNTTKVGNGFVYRPAHSAISILRDAADTLLGNAARGTTGPLLAHMLESSPLDEADLDSLQQLIDEKKKSLGSDDSKHK
ncbi:MAG: BlaI/MecI/CopY family transcriptional regulator [Pirellulales bacterium]|nr:BlaI/MecI/CopY family transcriptional regulator [Pirellulales bacterium]